MRNAPTNRDDIIYSRDVIARIEELTDERDALQEAIDEAQTALVDALKAVEALAEYDDNDDDDETQAAFDDAQARMQAIGYTACN